MSNLGLRIPSVVVVAFAAVTFACGDSAPKPEAPKVEPSAVPSAAPLASSAPSAAPAPADAGATKAEPAKPPAPTPAVKWTGFSTPESVLVDEARDRYLVSNINGRPVDADNNGFISVLGPDGKVENLKWIEGGKNKVTLNAPKGMAVVKDVLYVADLDTLRMFDVKSGAPKGEVKLEGATFANDVVASEDGSKIYVSDSGLKMEGSDFKPTGTDAVWVVEKGKAKALAKTTDLAKPNGLLVDGKGLLVAPFGSNELYKLDDKGAKGDATKLPKGSLDGIARVGDALLVSSWEGQAVYKGKPGGTFEPVLQSLEAPADIGYDKKRGRVLVPRFMGNVVEAYDVK